MNRPASQLVPAGWEPAFLPRPIVTNHCFIPTESTQFAPPREALGGGLSGDNEPSRGYE